MLAVRLKTSSFTSTALSGLLELIPRTNTVKLLLENGLLDLRNLSYTHSY